MRSMLKASEYADRLRSILIDSGVERIGNIFMGVFILVLIGDSEMLRYFITEDNQYHYGASNAPVIFANLIFIFLEKSR